MKKLLLVACLLVASCSIPQVEDARCTASREPVRSFFAQHLGSRDDAGFTRESLAKKEKFLTPELYALLQKELDRQDRSVIFVEGDPFTDTPEEPSGFKVGKCEPLYDNMVTQTVRLFWKKDNKQFEGDIKIKTVLRESQWLISDFVGEKNGSLNERSSKTGIVN